MASSLQDTRFKYLVNVANSWQEVPRVVSLITHYPATFNVIKTLSGLARFTTQPLMNYLKGIASSLRSDTM